MTSTQTAGKLLSRVTFATSRMMDFCSEKELTAQTGHGRQDWPLVVLKELLDNALDATEEAGVPPKVKVTVKPDSITVTDNGPGLPVATVRKILNFNIRASSREAYMAPDRGAQGNAMKTLVLMPFILDGTAGRTEITAQGVRHVITIRVDAIRQQPVVDHRQERVSSVKKGTSVTMQWPDAASCVLADAAERFLQIVGDYSTLNPHLDLRIDWMGTKASIPAIEPAWRKWQPSDPTCPHWYSAQDLGRLIGAYIADDEDHGRERTVREFVSEFRGLSGTAKQKAVLEASGLSRVTLSSLINGDGLDTDQVGRLLKAMRENSKPVKPSDLGIIGRENIASRFAEFGCQMRTFEYRRLTKTTDTGLPFVLEAAFGWCGDVDDDGQIVTGINFSPGILNPFRQFGYGSLERILEKQYVSTDEPVVFLLHFACPRVQYLDRGKSSIIIQGGESPYPTDIIALVESVTKRWAKQRKQEDRSQRAASRRVEAMTRPDRKVTIKDVATRVMANAYAKASSDGRYPAHARQIFYAARPQILEEATDCERVDSVYFTQTLLPNYLEEHPEETGSWDVVFDARGHLSEPHTEVEVALGTVAVRRYLAATATRQAVEPVTANQLSTDYPTAGPRLRYGAILFIEKEGFNPLFEAAQIANRWDVAIMSTKGMSTTAARCLVDSLCQEQGIPLMVLHDFDKAGLSILRTLTRSTRRYQFQNKMHVIDLGLRLADVHEYQLQSEQVVYGKSDPRPNLRANGASEDEVDFLCAGESPTGDYYVGQRVELNAFTSEQLLGWLEAKLREHGVAKLIPAGDVLQAAYRRAAAIHEINRQVESIARDAEVRADALMLDDERLVAQVAEFLGSHPALAWDAAIAALAYDALSDE